MIYFSGLCSILESLYLGIPLTDSRKEATIYVNPVHTYYLTGKTIIINRQDYGEEQIETLQRNINTIFSRTFISPLVTLVPYIPKLVPGILWSGAYQEGIHSSLGFGEEQELELNYTYDDTKLYFPKIKSNIDIQDKLGNLDFLGYLLYQLGENFYKETPFRNLDIVKIGKGMF